MINNVDNRWSDEDSNEPQQKNGKKIEKKLENLENSGQRPEKSIQEYVPSSRLDTKPTDNMRKLEKPKKEDQAITKSDIKTVIKILQQMATGVIELQGMLPYRYNDKGRDTIRMGRAHIYKFTNYYDVVSTIKKEGPEDPNDFDSPVYNKERIYQILERYSDIINVINDDKIQPLFIIVSHEGKTTFSKESVIYPGETKTFFNTYELRFRSAKKGHQYRVTEYPISTVTAPTV